MFFHISKEVDSSFPNILTKNSYNIHYDNGWSSLDFALYKGITEEGILSITSENDIEKYRSANGTFCIMYFKNNRIEIISGRKQKYPLFVTESSVSNTYTDGESIHGNVIITSTEIQKTDLADITYQNLNLNDDQIIDLLDEKINNYVSNFNFSMPLKVYPTGGLDSIMLIAYVLKNKIPYELVVGEHAEMDHFACYHRTTLPKKFWAYTTIQHWKEPSILLTGAHGDETLLRDALQAYAMLKYHGEDLVEVCQNNTSLYQSLHYLKDECLKTYEENSTLSFDNEYDLKTWILNVFRKDYQHWHLGNTLFFAPLDNLDLLNISLNLSWETSRKQLLEGYVSRELIKRHRPKLLSLVSPQKNINYYQNLAPLFEGKITLKDL